MRYFASSASFFLVLVTAASFVQAQEPGATELVLHTLHPDKAPPPKSISGKIPRELCRQALLFAAREELGMRTCDKSLREVPATDNPLSLLMTAELTTKGKCKLALFRVDEVKPGAEAPDLETAVWSKTLRYRPNSKATYPSLVKALREPISKDFVELLQGLGGVRVDVAGEIDKEVDVQSLAMSPDVVSQFFALRQMHLRNRAEPSAETMQGLVRVYANLSLLSEAAWGAAAEVMHARSLLYGDRLQVLFPDDELTGWSQAYAASILGRPFLLDQYAPQATAEDLAFLPEWTPLAFHYARFEGGELKELAEAKSPSSAWAGYLYGWSIYNSGESRQLTFASRTVLQAAPAAMNSYRMLVRGQPIGIMRMSSQAEMQALLRLLPAKLKEMEALPDKVLQVVDKPDFSKPPGHFYHDIVTSLRGVDSQLDPPWATLASLLEDQAVRAATNSLSVNISASTEQDMKPIVEFWRPFVQGHEAEAHLNLVALRGNSPTDEEVAKLAKKLRYSDPSNWITVTLGPIRSFAPANEIVRNTYRRGSREFTCQSIARNLIDFRSSESDNKMYVRELGKVSPYCPYVLVSQIKKSLNDVDKITDNKLEDWKSKAGSSSQAWYSLARAYSAKDRPKDAIESYEVAIGLSPEYDFFQGLAGVHVNEDDLDAAVATMKRYLKVEDYGLGHSNSHIVIAKYLLMQGKVAEAKKHAIEAADAYSFNGLGYAALVCEIAGDLEAAKKWRDAQVQSYPSSAGFEWYFFCKRNNLPEIDRAREATARHLGDKKAWAKSKDWRVLQFCILDEEYQVALEFIRDKQANPPDWYAGSVELVLGLELGDQEAIEAGRNRIGKSTEKEWMVDYVALAEEILDSTEADAGSLSEKVLGYFDKHKAQPHQICLRGYLLGKMLQKKGHEQDAQQVFKRVFETYLVSSSSWALSFWELKQVEGVPAAAAAEVE